MRLKLNIMLLPVIFCLVGCSSVPTSTTSSVTPTASPDAILSDTNKVPTDSSEMQSESKFVLPLTENTSGKVQIQTVSSSSTYPYTSYIITSANGESIVLDPTSMPPKEVIDLLPAAIISTHAHSDHTDSSFTNTYDCPHFTAEVTTLDTKDFKIATLASSHQNDTIDQFPSNTITLLEVDGIRIAHMGDIGQSTFTEEQLTILGHIDIAFMQFHNDGNSSGLGLTPEKSFKLMEQLKPTIIIPTHYTEDFLPDLEQKYGEIQEFDNVLTISKDDLLATSVNMYRILNTHVYQ